MCGSFALGLLNVTGAKRYGVLALCGVIFALPFVFPKLFLLSWIGLALPFLLIKSGNKRVFSSLFCFFVPFYVTLYSWFVNLYPLDFAGLGGFQSFLVILCALTLIPAIHTALSSGIMTAFLKFAPNKGIGFCFTAAFSYVGAEYLQSLGALAFPWGRLFVAQTSRLEILQSASLSGSYLITFIIVFCNALLALYLEDTKKRTKLIYAICAVMIFALNLCYGAVKLNTPIKAERHVTAAALQGSMSSHDKWSGNITPKSLEIYSQLLSKAAIQKDSDTFVAVTPETAFPTTLHADGEPYVKYANDVLNELSQSNNCLIVAGAFEEVGEDCFNSLYMYSPKQPPQSFYRKTKLVPFGEYLPYRRAIQVLLPVLSDINLLGSDLSTPSSPAFPFEADGIRFGGLVCFDSIFGEVCRKQVKHGAQIIVLSTNDSWYKTSRALDQHLAHAQMRAIENGVSIIRSANTGISANILPNGKICGSLGALKRGAVVSKLPVSEGFTLYTQMGDVIVYAAWGYLGVCALLWTTKRIQKAKGRL